MTKRLGRGLSEIIDAGAEVTPNVVMLRIDQIRAGRFQPRTAISEAGLKELKASIQKCGVIEPIIVRPLAHGIYELVAGERRLRATQLLGREEIPALIRTLADREALEYSLIENIQREDLNPIDEARAYARLLDEFGYTQEDIASGVGKDRATVANALRLLKLPEEMQQGLRDGKISAGHGRALVGMDHRARQMELYRKAAGGRLTVRDLEEAVGAAATTKRRGTRRADPRLLEVEGELRQALGTKVRIAARKRGGRIVIEYFSPEDLTRILGVLGLARDDG